MNKLTLQDLGYIYQLLLRVDLKGGEVPQFFNLMQRIERTLKPDPAPQPATPEPVDEPWEDKPDAMST